MRRIVLLICWKGKFPWYFPYFLHSCQFPYAIEQFKAETVKALEFEVALETGYKLCDFKPAFGHIFSNYIRDYDCWGYCDVDVIFGNIRPFMREEQQKVINPLNLFVNYFFIYKLFNIFVRWNVK